MGKHYRPKTIVGKRLNELRIDMGLTERQMEEDLNASHQTVSAWISQYRYPQATMTIKICKKYGVSADWLLGLSDRRER